MRNSPTTQTFSAPCVTILNASLIFKILSTICAWGKKKTGFVMQACAMVVHSKLHIPPFFHSLKGWINYMILIQREIRKCKVCKSFSLAPRHWLVFAAACGCFFFPPTTQLFKYTRHIAHSVPSPTLTSPHYLPMEYNAIPAALTSCCPN